MKVELTENDLQSLLAEQLEFLELSSAGFDGGFEGEIKRLAVSVRVLVHDARSSVSLLNLMDKKGIRFLDTSVPYDELNIISHSSLTAKVLGEHSVKNTALLDDGPFSRFVSFDAWWNGIVFVDVTKNEFSRKDIVLSLANKEGGAHVDKQLDKKYADLRKNNSLGWYESSPDGKEIPGSDEVPVTMRQIAHELLRTLKEGYVCRRDVKQGDGVLVFGASMVEGGRAPSIHEYNLPKNRPVVYGRAIGRNDSCPCGSGKKYKKCCMI